MLTYDAYHRPTTLNEALGLWSQAPKGSQLVSGATDLLPWAREGRAGDIHLPSLIDLSNVAELKGYSFDKGRVHLGANTVYQDFLTDGTLRRALPVMPYASIWFADDQIREVATLAGNLANASPVADGTPPVIAMNGSVELARLAGNDIVTRTLTVDEFIQGPGKTQIEQDEIMTRVSVDSCYGYGGSFQKVGQRRSLVISVACCAALVKTDPEGRYFEDVRLSLGGVGPRPIRLSKVESMLRGERVSADLITKAAVGAADTVGSRSRVDYRRDVVVNFVRAALQEALENQPNLQTSEKAEETANV
jgi:xanthine dehydrogenase FAD-binding subunit